MNPRREILLNALVEGCATDEEAKALGNRLAQFDSKQAAFLLAVTHDAPDAESAEQSGQRLDTIQARSVSILRAAGQYS